jgi:hypothetical protein
LAEKDKNAKSIGLLETEQEAKARFAKDDNENE